MNLKELQEVLDKNIIRVASVVPENALSNYYENLKTLKYNIYHLDKKNNKDILPTYRPEDNSINICIETLNIFNNYTDGSDRMYKELVNSTVFHELLHVASTKRGDNILSGFITSGNEDKLGINVGLTEGYTDLLTRRYNNYNFKEKVGYKELRLIAKELELLLGKYTMANIYFNNKGYQEIVKEFSEIGVPSEVSIGLLPRIEYYYEYVFRLGKKDEVLIDINTMLNYLLSMKISHMLKTGEPRRKIIILLHEFEKNYIDKEKLEFFKSKGSYQNELDDVKNEFLDYKNSVVKHFNKKKVLVKHQA